MKFIFVCFPICLSWSIVSQPIYSDPYTIGTQWVYERVEYMYFLATYDYITYEITDTVEWRNKPAFKIENDKDGGIHFMHVAGDSIYFWLPAMNDYQLMYDFSDEPILEIPWVGICHTDSGTAMVILDSITQIHQMQVFEQQHNRIQNNGTLEEDLEINVIKYVGADRFGLRFPLGRGLCDTQGPAISKLRCFTNGDVHLQLVDYPCDTTWTLNTATDDIEQNTLAIYPNPADGMIQFQEDFNNLPYQLIDALGMVFQEGIVRDNRIMLENSGLYFLLLQNQSKFFVAKVVNR